MLLVKPWWDFCTEVIVSSRNWRHQFQLEMENRRRQWEEPYGEKDLSARWVLLTGFEKSHLPAACFTHWKKERKYHAASCVLVICCLTSNAYHAGYALSTTRLLKTIFGVAGYRRYNSLRDRRLEGKGKGVLGARETWGPGRPRREGRKRFLWFSWQLHSLTKST